MKEEAHTKKKDGDGGGKIEICCHFSCCTMTGKEMAVRKGGKMRQKRRLRVIRRDQEEFRSR